MYVSMYVCMYAFILEEEEGREKERKRNSMWESNMDRLPLVCAPAGDGTRIPGMCPDQESTWRPIVLWDDAQPTEPHTSGQPHLVLNSSPETQDIIGNSKLLRRQKKKKKKKHCVHHRTQPFWQRPLLVCAHWVFVKPGEKPLAQRPTWQWGRVANSLLWLCRLLAVGTCTVTYLSRSQLSHLWKSSSESIFPRGLLLWTLSELINIST